MAIAIYEKKIVVTEASIDILGHVNNREYLRWMEEVAIEHSAALGWPQERYMAEQHVWVAREHWIEYLRPALLGDHLSVYTWLQETAGPICLRRYAVVRGPHRAYACRDRVGAYRLQNKARRDAAR